MCCKINANNFSINVKTLKRFNIILTFCVMYTVYGLFFCTCAEISGQKYYLLKRSVSDEINIIEFCMISRPRFFPPESPYANIFQQANTKNPTLFSRQLSHPRVYVWCLGLGHIYFQVFADVTKGRYHQTLLLPRTPHDLWLAEIHHKNYLFYHSNYFWFKHGKTLA